MWNYRANSLWAQCIAGAASSDDRNQRIGCCRQACACLRGGGAAEDVGLNDLWKDAPSPVSATSKHRIDALEFASRLATLAVTVRDSRALLWLKLNSSRSGK